MTTLTDAAAAPPGSGPTLEAPRYRRLFGVGRERWVQYGVLAVLALLVLAPVVPTLLHLLTDPRLRLDHSVRAGRFRERAGPGVDRDGAVEPVLDSRHGRHRGGRPRADHLRVLGAASTLILIVTVGLVALQAKLLKDAQRFVSVRGKATRPRRLNLGWMQWVGVAAISLYVVFGALLPIGGLIFRSFTRIFTPLQSPFRSLTGDNYERIVNFPVYIQSIWNSLIVAGLGAILISLLATFAVVVARRSTFRYRRLVEYIALAPQAIPGIIIGIGLFWAFAYLPFGLGGLVQGTLFALIIGFGLRALPSGFGSIAPSVMQIGQELDNAARVSGADWVRTFTWVLGRLLTPAFAGAVILTFVTMLKEYSPAIFLGSANSNIIGTTMLELWVQGNTGSVAALATIQIAITAAFVGIAGLLMKGHTDA
jgi:iron(III) transport system permease protein